MPREKIEYKCGHKVERDVKRTKDNRTPADEAFIKRMKNEVSCVDCRRKAGTAKRNDKVKADKKAKADKPKAKAKSSGKSSTKAKTKDKAAAK